MAVIRWVGAVAPGLLRAGAAAAAVSAGGTFAAPVAAARPHHRKPRALLLKLLHRQHSQRRRRLRHRIPRPHAAAAAHLRRLITRGVVVPVRPSAAFRGIGGGRTLCGTSGRAGMGGPAIGCRRPPSAARGPSADHIARCRFFVRSLKRLGTWIVLTISMPRPEGGHSRRSPSPNLASSPVQSAC